MADPKATGARDTAEHRRLAEAQTPKCPWRTWGPYLSERQWGTVREDYSPDGTAWEYLSHDAARSRAYRWGEDGILGISDNNQHLCFAVAMWNGKDPILKERLFGLTNTEGNHGEDVKELYYFLDATPTNSYLKGVYLYPHAEYPYANLVEENRRRGQLEPEYELLDTGVMDQDRYFEVQVEYAKANCNDIAIRLTVTNRGPETASLTFLPQIWARNRWSWESGHKEVSLSMVDPKSISVHDKLLGSYMLVFDGQPEQIFTENETNKTRLFGSPNEGFYVKDAFHRYLIEGEKTAINPNQTGTKAALVYKLNLKAGESKVIKLRLVEGVSAALGSDFDEIFTKRIAEANEFYEALTPGLPVEVANVQRQAFAGLIWSKQYFHFDVRAWLKGDPLQPPPPAGRSRNADWKHFDSADVLSMPDTWEYPWFAAWDLAFHCIPFAIIDPAFAKEQLTLLVREWYMHPNGQIPAYEWAFGDVNPPVHAWAAWRVYTIDRRSTGKGDVEFLERIFHKLLLNFTWWVNRKDAQGNNVFEGGFLGLDNIGVFDRNQPLPNGMKIEQSDGTSWMGMFCLSMLTIALELAKERPAYEDVAIKFLEHFIYIADAMNKMGENNLELWDDEDGFYYDILSSPGMTHQYLKVRSLVGLIPLFAVTTIDPETMDRFPMFRERIEWFLEYRQHAVERIASITKAGMRERRIFSLVSRDRLERIATRVFAEAEFLSPYGIRALSRFHEERPYMLYLNGELHSIGYEPGESTTRLFGGNSNWRGPLWFPGNYLLIEALQNLDYYYGSDLRVEFPVGSGKWFSLSEAAMELEKRLISIFVPGENGERPVFSGIPFYKRPNANQWLLFHEYFHADTGKGLGASHQTGWTGLIAKIIQQTYYTAADVKDTSSIFVEQATSR